ncbi:MAG: glycosyltransferase family 4 protein [Lachnospiraceae bacterium]|nr:glycosyltransferase family 4 protein [Lachnospiraceae bacterium]
MGMKKKIAIIAPGYAWLPGEAGTSRFSYMAGFLAEHGYKVDLIGSTFQHFKKAPRDIERLEAMQLPYKLVFIEEPGYRKNIDIRRIYSNYILARNTLQFLERHISEYDLVYCVIPPNVLSAKAGKICHKYRVPFIVDIEDLWPEAMKMVFKVPFVSNALFYPYWRDAEKTYRYANGVVGTSDEYTMRAFKKRKKDIPYATVYVGTELDVFDEGVCKYSSEFEKSNDEFWVTYAGSIGASYDIRTLIDAAKMLLCQGRLDIKIYILGTGPLKEELEQYAKDINCENVIFMGYVEYQKMAAFLSKSDVLINSYVKNAPQSIVTKIGDYLAAGKPMINTLASSEFMEKVERERFGINIEAENQKQLVMAILKLLEDPEDCVRMGRNARNVAEMQFDRKAGYRKVLDMVEKLTE